MDNEKDVYDYNGQVNACEDAWGGCGIEAVEVG